MRFPAFWCDALEPRLFLATFSVTNTLDAGAGSLRKALTDANATPLGVNQDHLVAFNIPGAGVRTIAPLSPLPEMTRGVIVDGTTQPGFDGKPLIELRGDSAGAGANGLVSRSGGTTRGLLINRWGGAGLRWYGDWRNIVEGCWIGLDSTGLAAAPNGVGVSTTGVNGRIGGTTPSQRNVISGNRTGVQIWREATLSTTLFNTVLGNYIGTDWGAASAVANTDQGVWILSGATRNVIGGTASGSGNVISGNAIGVRLSYPPDTRAQFPGPELNRVEGNIVGLGWQGFEVPNGVGVLVEDWVDRTVIGGPAAGARNIISGNSSAGVRIVQGRSTLVRGNWIGTDLAGTGARPNAIGVDVSGPNGGALLTEIGGEVTGQGNVISGNVTGVRIRGYGNFIRGNLIGARPDGGSTIGNGTGIEFSGDSTTFGNGVVGGIYPGEGNVIAGNDRGLVIQGPRAGGVYVAGNFIGTNPEGFLLMGNGRRDGNVAFPAVQIIDSSNNGVGWSSPSDNRGRNVISGNASGVEIVGGKNNKVRGNYLGTNPAGTAALPNGGLVGLSGNGVVVRDLPAATGSETTEVTDNLISGNTGDGLILAGATTRNVLVERNVIGTNAQKTAALPNRWGMVLIDSGNHRVNHNVVAGNQRDGVWVGGLAASSVFQFNSVGNVSTGGSAVRPLPNGGHGVLVHGPGNQFIDNTVAHNGGDGFFVEGGPAYIRGGRIFSNGGLGIDLGPINGVSPPGPANGGYPVITEVIVADGFTYVAGTLDAVPGSLVQVDVYAGGAADPSGYGEGSQYYVSSNRRTVPAGGRIEWEAKIPRQLAEGEAVTATAQAITISGPAAGTDTSEFSAAFPAPPLDQNRPRVAQVFVASSKWTPQFLQRLQEQGLGSEVFGYAVPAGDAQWVTLPWSGIDRISIRFTRDVTTNGVAVVGATGSTLLSYDPATFTATTALLDPVRTASRLGLRMYSADTYGTRDRIGRPLDGEWTDGADAYPSGDNAPGGDFAFTVNALPGDATRSGAVNPADLTGVRIRQGRSAARPGAGASAYSVLYDVDGSGTIDVRDYAAVRSRQQTTLPPPPTPPTPPAAQAEPTARAAPPRRQLFAVASILG